MSSETTRFDVVVVGTGLSESIAASSLAKEGLAVLQLDRNDCYGDRHASLTVTELMEWLDAIGRDSPGPKERPRYANASYAFPSDDAAPADSSAATFKASIPRTSRLYSLSLYPALLPARGDLVDTLVERDVGKYVSFRTVDGVGLSNLNTSSTEPRFETLPSSKESIFKDSTLTLMDKRRLMKCLMWVGDAARSTGLMDASERTVEGVPPDGDELLLGKETMPFLEFLTTAFSLSRELAETIAFGIAHCSSGSEPALPAIRRMNKYLRSAGRYGPSAFLVGQYGGAGEVVQAFCRSCAVYGGTYILGEASQISDFHILSESIPPVKTSSEEGKVDPDGPPQASLPAQVSFKIPAFDLPVTAGHIICPPDATFLPATTGDGTVSHKNNCIAIVKTLPIIASAVHTVAADVEVDEDEASERNQRDVFILVFKPERTEDESVRVLFMGPATGSCPEGQYIMYMQSTGAQELHQYVEWLYPSTGPQPLFVSWYTALEYRQPHRAQDGSVQLICLSGEPGVDPTWFEGLDAEVREGARLTACCLP